MKINQVEIIPLDMFVITEEKPRKLSRITPDLKVVWR